MSETSSRALVLCALLGSGTLHAHDATEADGADKDAPL